MKIETIEAGLAVRAQIRTYLLRTGIDFKEDKGWVESTFYCKVTEDQWKVANRDLIEWKKKINS